MITVTVTGGKPVIEATGQGKAEIVLVSDEDYAVKGTAIIMREAHSVNAVSEIWCGPSRSLKSFETCRRMLLRSLSGRRFAGVLCLAFARSDGGCRRRDRIRQGSLSELLCARPIF